MEQLARTAKRDRFRSGIERVNYGCLTVRSRAVHRLPLPRLALPFPFAA
jgi:hypothetical protein